MITPLPPYPAAMVKTRGTRTIVVTDLHLGWEMALSHEGIHVPTQTPKLLRKMIEIIEVYKPEKLLILGDVKHTVATAEAMEWRDIPDFFAALEKQIQEIAVIRGNHDGNLEPLLPDSVKVLSASGIAIGDVGFFHGHRWPLPTLLGCKTLVMGHVHPVVAFRDPAGFRVMRQVWVKANCSRQQLAKVLLEKNRTRHGRKPEEIFSAKSKIKPRISQLFIMPSFNDFLGGRPLNERRPISAAKAEIVGPVLRSDAVDIRNAETYLLDGTFLGTLEQLRNLSLAAP